MKWIGYWLIAVAILHGAVALMLFGATYFEFATSGIWGSVVTESDRLALWFGAAAPMILLLGMCLLNIPRPPRALGLTLGALALLGALLQPVSGFWVLLPPAAGLIISSMRREDLSPN